MYSFLDFLSEFLERYSWAIVPSLIGTLVVALVWRKVPKPIFTKPKTELKVKVVFRNRRRIEFILVIIGVSLWVTGLILGQLSDLKWLGLCIYFIGWAPYILGAWVL